MELAARTGAWTPSGAPLPYDAEVEWIALSANKDSYFDTEIDTANDIGFEVVCSKETMISSDSLAFGARANYNDTRFFVGATINGLWYWGWNGRFDYHTCKAGEICRLGMNFKNNRKHSLNGIDISDIQSPYEHSVRLFFGKYNHRSYPSPSTMDSYYRYYRLSLSKGNGVVREFCPVRFTNENGVSEGAMYDRVSGQLFRNAGTGAFIVGPDVVSTRGGGTKCLTPRRSYRRLARSSARFCAHSQEWEVAA